MRDFVVSFTTSWRARKRVLEWVRDEWVAYANLKWADIRVEQREHMLTEGVGPDSWWRKQTMEYLQRSHTLGLDTPLGRQALAKVCTASLDMLAIATEVYGDLPPAGLPSGELGT